MSQLVTFSTRVCEWVSDRANPVVVKELRQAVQSRLVAALLLLFLLINVVIISGYVTLSVDIQTRETAGQELFGILFSVLVTTCMVFVPTYVAVRMTMERNHSNIDLLFITTIQPGAIIRGKFWSALALMGLIYSACMPFLVFTYLLRGVDLPSIFFALATSFFCTSVVIMLAIFFGSVPGGWLMRLLMAWLLIWAIASGISTSIASGIAAVQIGLPQMFSTYKAWAIAGSLLLAGLAVTYLLYFLAVAATSAKSSNRMFAVRVFITVCWIVFGFVAATWAWIETSEFPIYFWLYTSIINLCLFLALILAEREEWSPRVRKTIPRTFLSRFAAWLFYTGSAGGVIWCALLSGITFGVSYAYISTSKSASSYRADSDFHEVLPVILLFTFCYGMTGVFIRRMLVPKTAPIVSTVIGLILLGVMSSVPLLVASFVYGSKTPNFRDLPIPYVIGNPFILISGRHDLKVIMIFLGIWAVTILLLNRSWFIKQWKAFTRYEPQTAPIPLTEAVAVTHD